MADSVWPGIHCQHLPRAHVPPDEPIHRAARSLQGEVRGAEGANPPDVLWVGVTAAGASLATHAEMAIPGPGTLPPGRMPQVVRKQAESAFIEVSKAEAPWALHRWLDRHDIRAAAAAPRCCHRRSVRGRELNDVLEKWQLRVVAVVRLQRYLYMMNAVMHYIEGNRDACVCTRAWACCFGRTVLFQPLSRRPPSDHHVAWRQRLQAMQL